ncbi:MAG: FHA domain-containing protein [Planctomycetes bacterium]|nr:FHA domain-containing protein [Planctomycetota bacterium]
MMAGLKRVIIMAIKLCVTLTKDSGNLLAELVFDKDKVAVGRSPENDLLLVDVDGMVSRTHAVFIKRGDDYVVMDFGSRNGTYVNDKRMEPSTTVDVKAGDTVRVGPYSVKVESTTITDVTVAVAKSNVIFNGPVKKPDDTGEVPALGPNKVQTAPLVAELQNPPTKAEKRPDLDEPQTPIPPKKETRPVRTELPTGKTENLPVEGVNEMVAASYKVMARLSEHFLGESSFTKPEQMELFGRLIEQTLDVTLDWLVKCLKGRSEFEGQFEAFVTMAFKRTNNPIKQVKNQMEIRRYPLDWRGEPDMENVKRMLEGAYRDLGEHQMGMVAGVQEAVQAIMRRIDPETMEQQVLAGAGGLGKMFAKMSLEKRAWRLYSTTYRELLAESTKLFNDVIFPSIRKGYLQSHSKEAKDPKPNSAPKIEVVKPN